jgi:hypothetical protein
MQNLWHNPTRAQLNEIWLYLTAAQGHLGDARPVLADRQISLAQTMLTLIIERTKQVKCAVPAKDNSGK